MSSAGNIGWNSSRNEKFHSSGNFWTELTKQFRFQEELELKFKNCFGNWYQFSSRTELSSRNCSSSVPIWWDQPTTLVLCCKKHRNAPHRHWLTHTCCCFVFTYSTLFLGLERNCSKSSNNSGTFQPMLISQSLWREKNKWKISIIDWNMSSQSRVWVEYTPRYLDQVSPGTKLCKNVGYVVKKLCFAGA